MVATIYVMTTRKGNGASIRTIRELTGISASELAQRVAIGRSYMSLIETGARQPATAKLRLIANALGTSIEAISYPVEVVYDEPGKVPA
ncbi:XRE family transcriptional regulator [Galactobacter valiniphilus]|uniref:XRE family transcriptional regulator n=2 Tax=Galactobacter valiniphilus TaxID=2676122 RepID=A0A399J8T4_9MICC|nr:XRE family transcriptional regulator [Galactobacter valiniphilus]